MKALFDPVGFVIGGYQILFSITTMMFEAKAEWIQKIPGLDSYQDLVIEHAQFLSEVGGRGLFYGFQGSLWLAFASINKLANLVLGLYFVVLFLFHMAMYNGIMPQTIAQKIREG